MTDIEKPDAATPAYALRELADWIEHRAAATPGKIPTGDVSRIKLGRQMADSLEKMFEVHSNTVAGLHQRIAELEEMKDLRTVQKKLDEIIGYLCGPSADEELIDADTPVVAPYQVSVANTPAEPVEAHQCSTLQFCRKPEGLLQVICDLGRSTDITIQRLVKMSANPQDAIMEIARRVATDHSLNVGNLFDKMHKHSITDLQTITMDTSSLRSPNKV